MGGCYASNVGTGVIDGGRAAGGPIRNPAGAPHPSRTAQGDVAVYNDGRALIQDRREQPIDARLEVRFNDNIKSRKVSGGSVRRREGKWVWETVIPAKFSRTLTARYGAS